MSEHAKYIAVLKSNGWDPRVEGVDMEVPTDDVICRRLFSNYRTDRRERQGLNLTKQGLAVMQRYFANWTIELPPEHKTTSRHLLYLDSVCRMPWYLHKNKLTLFDADFAMWAKLVGDLDTLQSNHNP